MSVTSGQAGATPFHADAIITGTTARLSLSGEVDATNAEHLRAAIGEHLTNPATNEVVADLVNLHFLGSAGLATLV